MHKFIKTISIFLSVICLSLCFAGCGGESDIEKALEENQKQYDKSLAEVKSKEWVVVTYTENKPFSYLDDEGNTTGFDVELTKAIAKDQGFKCKIKALSADSAVDAVKSGEADVIIAALSMENDLKGDDWLFSSQYYNSPDVLVVPKDSQITDYSVLSGLSVGVLSNSSAYTFTESMKNLYGFEIKEYEDNLSMCRAVANGEIAACMGAKAFMKTTVRDNSLELSVLENVSGMGENYAIAVYGKGNKAFLQVFNEGLANITQNGEYNQLALKYLQ